MSLRLVNGTTIEFAYADVGMEVAEGGLIKSVQPFVTENGLCVIDDEIIELNKTGDQRIAVYLENVSGVSSYSAYFVFHGNTLAELREALLDRLAWSAEHLPSIEFFTSRMGVVKRRLCGPLLSRHIDSVYVYMK